MKTFRPIESIITGISEKLNTVFGDAYEIYPEEVKQGMNVPCFFINLINHTNTIERGETYHLENTFCIRYFPKSENQPKSECYGMLNDLFLALEQINIGEDTIRGVNKNGEIHDGTLLFFVNYNVFVRKVVCKEKMKELEHTNYSTRGDF